MLTKPLPLGEPIAIPLEFMLPHAVIAPDASSAAKARSVEEMLTKPAARAVRAVRAEVVRVCCARRW